MHANFPFVILLARTLHLVANAHLELVSTFVLVEEVGWPVLLHDVERVARHLIQNRLVVAGLVLSPFLLLHFKN